MYARYGAAVTQWRWARSGRARWGLRDGRTFGALRKCFSMISGSLSIHCCQSCRAEPSSFPAQRDTKLLRDWKSSHCKRMHKSQMQLAFDANYPTLWHHPWMWCVCAANVGRWMKRCSNPSDLFLSVGLSLSTDGISIDRYFRVLDIKSQRSCCPVLISKVMNYRLERF